MDLRTGDPVWLADEPDDLSFPALRKNAVCDVAIIGAGITGALVAHQLIDAGLRVVVLDKRAIGRGSTAASTGLLMYQTDTSLADLTRIHGGRTARRVYQLGRKAVRELGQLTRALKQPCGFMNKRALYVASKPRDTRFLKSEARRSHHIDFPAAVLNHRILEDRFHLDRPAALGSTGSAQVNAFQLTRAVLRHHRRSPLLRVFQNSNVASLREKPDGTEIHLSSGHRVRARYTIVAAGYEAGRFIESELVELHSTYVIASKPFPAGALWPTECLMWETARPYFYLRTTADHRIIFGGRDERFSDPKRRDKKLAQKTGELERQFAELFPALAFRAEFAWTGTFAETRDGLPCIGPAVTGSRVLYALGYGGNGITFSQIAARILRDLCLEKPNADSTLFRFDRFGSQPTSGLAAR